MSKHLNDKEITGYRQSSLLPSELLTVDNHLANCANCRRKIKQNQDLAMLYDSFFDPLSEFSTDNSRDKNFGLKGKWELSRKFRFFSMAAIFANRQTQAALILVLFLVVGGLWAFRQKTAPPSNEFSANNRGAESFLPDIPDNKGFSTPKKDAEEIKNVKADSDIKIGKPNKTQAFRAKKESSGTAIEIEIKELETDGSQTLSSDGNPAEAVKSSPKLQIGKNSRALDFSFVQNADEYEVYLAEMPKFVTVSREKVKARKWTIPYRKLKAGQNYVLQITALKNGQSIQSVKKIINTKAIQKNN